MKRFFQVQSPARLISLGFAVVILLGSALLIQIGRLGPLTVASLWYFSRGERISFPEGNLSIG